VRRDQDELESAENDGMADGIDVVARDAMVEEELGSSIERTSVL
jgi:hypothetical protein